MSADNITWFHSFEMDDGSTIKGLRPLSILKSEADAILPASLAGKSLLDIGAWDGYFSFEAERRGASRVMATDHFCWSGEGWGTKAGFDHIHQQRGSKVESKDVDVMDLPHSGLGQFDVVLFLGVFYHLKDPYIGLEAAASMCSDHLVVETETTFAKEKLPAMRLLEPRELNSDPTNFWVPNIPALELMLRNFGFKRIEAMKSPNTTYHPLATNPFHKPKHEAFHRTIVHAWRS